MEKDETININLIIADRPYPLKIKQSEEEEIRIVAKEINQKVKDFQLSYGGKDKQDFLAMTALMYAVENKANQKKTSQADSKLHDEIAKFENLLKQFS